MDSTYIYFFNLRNSEEFASLDALYHVLTQGQEEKWEIWWNYASKIPPREAVNHYKTLEKFIKNENLRFLYQASIKETGEFYESLDSICSFIVSYHKNDKDFYNIV